MEYVEQLSELIIAVLKELSSARQPLTNVSLGQALSDKPEFHDLLCRTYQNGMAAGKNVPEKQEDDSDGQASRNRLREARKNEQHLQRRVAGLEEMTSQMRSFYKKAALTLVLLAGDTQNSLLAACLERYRSLIMSDADLTLHEECIQEIKDMVLREGVGTSAGHRNEAKGGTAKTYLKEAPELASKPEVGSDLRQYLSRAQSTYLSILGQLEPLIPREQKPRTGDLQQHIKNCEDLNSLFGLSGELVAVMEAYFDYAAQEREQVSAFIAELARNLLEMEKQFSWTVNDSQDSYRANVEFSSSLQVQMEDMHQSVSIAKTLEESRNYVFSKLQSIKSALEQKRHQDEMRLRNNNEKLGELQTNLQSMKVEILRAQERSKTLEQEVLQDGLTGIGNRRAYEIRILEEYQRFKRYNQVFSLVLFDVDHFKKVNDTYGHRAGDKCLKEIINRVKPCLRTADFLARYGGEEFAIIITGTKKEEAHQVAQKIRRLVERTRFLFQGQAIPVTISLGVTDIQTEDPDPEAVFTRADDGMYKAKRTGRNRVCVV